MAGELGDDDLKFLLQFATDFKEVDAALQHIISNFDTQSKSIQKIVAGYSGQIRELEQIKALSDPTLIKAQVALQNEKIRLQEQYNGLLAQEQKIHEQVPDILPEKVGATQEQLDALRQLATKHAETGGGLGELLPEVEAGEQGGGGGILQGIMKALGGKLGQSGGIISKLLGGAIGGAEGGVLGALGGGAAGAVGGPAGIAVAAGMEVFNKASSAALTPLKGLSSALSEMRSSLGPIGVGFEAISSSLKSIPILGPVLGQAVDSVRQITEILVSFAAKASPGIYKRYQIALEDAQAVIGQAFLPILQHMTNAVRWFGDVLANVLPSAQEVRDALAPIAPLFADIATDLKQIAVDAGPGIREFLIANLKLLTAALYALILPIKALIYPIQLLKQLLGQGGEVGPRSSVGAAARPAHFASIEGFQQSFQTAAYSEPGAITQQQVPSMLSDIRGILYRIEALIPSDEKIKNALSAIFQPVRNASDAIGEAAGNVRKHLPEGLIPRKRHMVRGHE
ncbi:MAG: hypothetical protein KGL39_40660 [Patescibacteria group bacterium]|nr:hypothetical protein [Patescibacteria group bacterium]